VKNFALQQATRTRFIVYALAAVLLLSACSGPAESNLSVSDAWARAASLMPMGEDATNTGASDEGMAMNDESEDSMDGGMNMDMSAGAVSAAYMTIENQGNAADRLVSASTDAAGVVEIHTSEMDDQGVMRMRPVPDGLEIPANSSLTLEPGGYHLMLMDLQRDLNAGDTITLTLNFESGKQLTVDAEIRAP